MPAGTLTNANTLIWKYVLEKCTHLDKLNVPYRHYPIAMADNNCRRRASTRRSILKSSGSVIVAGIFAGLGATTAVGSSEKASLSDHPHVREEYRTRLANGEFAAAAEILEEYNVPYGINTATARSGSIVERDAFGPFGNASSQDTGSGIESQEITTQDEYKKGASSFGLGAAYDGTVDVDGTQLDAYIASLFFSLSTDGSVNYSEEAPEDIAAISFDDTHWLARDAGAVRFPGSIGEGGGVNDYEIKSDHVKYWVNDPSSLGISDGSWAYEVQALLLMHPNASGVSQIYGNYAHTWSSVTDGQIEGISVGPGTFSVSVSWAASDWEVDLDPLLVSSDRCDPRC